MSALTWALCMPERRKRASVSPGIHKAHTKASGFCGLPQSQGPLRQGAEKKHGNVLNLVRAAEIAIALHEQGITLVVDEIDSILKILRQEDMVGFRPWPDKYMDRDGVTSQMWLPHIGDVSREIYWKIIKNTTWHKQKEAWPNE